METGNSCKLLAFLFTLALLLLDLNYCQDLTNASSPGNETISPKQLLDLAWAYRRHWEECYDEAIHFLSGVRPDMYSLNFTRDSIAIIAEGTPLMGPDWVKSFANDSLEAQIYELMLEEERIPKVFLEEAKTKVTARGMWAANSAAWRTHWRQYLDECEKNLSGRYFSWEDKWMKLYKVALSENSALLRKPRSK